MAHTLKIRGTLISSTTTRGAEAFDFTWGPSDLRNRISVASFTLWDQSKTLPFTPSEGDEVLILDTDGTTRLFGGHIAQIERRSPDSSVGRMYRLTCQDWNYLMDKIRVTVTLPAGQPDGVSAQYIWSQGPTPTPNFTVGGAVTGTDSFTSFTAGGLLPAITFTNVSVRSALDTLSDMVGGVAWYIDAYKRFHWNDPADLAPFIVTTDPSPTLPVSSYAKAFQTDAFQTDTFQATDTTYSPVSPFEPMENFLQYVDRSTHINRITVNGTGGATATATDFVSYAQAMLQASREGIGSGAFFFTQRFLDGDPVSDTRLTTNEQCKQRAYLELAKRPIRRRVSFRVRRAGLHAGQRIDLIHNQWDRADAIPAANYSRVWRAPGGGAFGYMNPGAMGRFLIQKVNPVALGNDQFAYDVDGGAYEAGLGVLLAANL